MQVLDEVNGMFAVGPVVMHTQEIRRMLGDTVHEIGDPFLTGGITGARRADEFLALVLA